VVPRQTRPAVSRTKLKLLTSLKHKKYRAKHGLFLAEGSKIVREAVKKNTAIEIFLARRISNADLEFLSGITIPQTVVAEDDFKKISQAATPQGVAALCRIPERNLEDIIAAGGPVVFIDGVQDPGNLGAILRAGWSFGIGGVLIAPGTADPYGPEAVRGSMGAVFHLPPAKVQQPAAGLEQLKDSGYTVYMADPEGPENLVNLDSAPVKFVLLLGSEARGPSEETIPLADKRIRIPQQPGSNSLNVAGAACVFLYHLTLIAARGRGRL